MQNYFGQNENVIRLVNSKLHSIASIKRFKEVGKIYIIIRKEIELSKKIKIKIKIKKIISS